MECANPECKVEIRGNRRPWILETPRSVMDTCSRKCAVRVMAYYTDDAGVFQPGGVPPARPPVRQA